MAEERQLSIDMKGFELAKQRAQVLDRTQTLCLCWEGAELIKRERGVGGGITGVADVS